MLLRKNTKAFKTILEIFTQCQSRADREQLIRLFITKAGNTVKERISVESIQGDAALFYEMNYQTILNSLKSSNHQLHESDEIPGLYYFHSTSNKSWDETPFEFDERVKAEFSSLPDLPIVRKKEKTEKYALPVKKVKPKETATKPLKEPKHKAVMVVVKGPKQPEFKLKHPIEFTNLDRILFRQPEITKLQLLTYYNDIAEYILPYLKDRAEWIKMGVESSRSPVALTATTLFADIDEIPEWLQSSAKKKQDELLANDREHLLLYVEKGALEFHPSHSKVKLAAYPDYLLILIDSPDDDLTKAIVVAQAIKAVLEGLQLPSFVKTDGASGLHVYIPLDSKSTYDIVRDAGESICKLVRLKIPELVALVGTEESGYGKVVLDYTLNEPGQSVIAPYSLAVRDALTIATPLEWDEVNVDLKADEFTPQTIFKRLKQIGDPLASLFKKRVSADELLQRLETNYSFLIS